MFAGDIEELLLRAVMSIALATLFVYALGPAAINLLRRWCREPVKSDSAQLDSLHRAKNGTPTMGGAFLVVAILFSAVTCGAYRDHGVVLALVVMCGMALIGAIDDLVKLHTRRAGLGWKGKLLGQFLVAAVPAACFYTGWCEPADEPLMILFGAGNLAGSWLIIPWCMVVVVATSNAVNITDGLDGLAAGCLALAVTATAVVTYLCVAGPARELVVVAGATLGALVGFLPLNRHPAQLFMGNVGSLALGGLLGYLALATGTELWLPLVGGVFAAEVVSVILQIGSFKLLGKRVLLCAPLHHHFEFRGWHEAKVVRHFWIAAACCAVAGVGLSLVGSSLLQSSTAAEHAEGMIMARHEGTSRR